MARLLDANTLFSGSEPKVSGELARIDLMIALNWYSQNKDAKDSLKWASEYLNKKLKLNNNHFCFISFRSFGVAVLPCADSPFINVPAFA